MSDDIPPDVLAAWDRRQKSRRWIWGLPGAFAFAGLSAMLSQLSGIDVIVPIGLSVAALGVCVSMVQGLRFWSIADERLIQQYRDHRRQRRFRAHDEARAAERDPRLDAAAGMADRIHEVASTDDRHHRLVRQMEARIARLVDDETTANAALAQIEAVDPGSAGAIKLREASDALHTQTAALLSGLSELYAALLSADADGSDAALAGLDGVLNRLEAEAEVDAHAREAMRPARGANAAKTQASTE